MEMCMRGVGGGQGAFGAVISAPTSTSVKEEGQQDWAEGEDEL